MASPARALVPVTLALTTLPYPLRPSRLGAHSYIIAITLLNMDSLQSGSKVIQGTGEAEFTLHYQALVMKPIKGEVVDCSVEKVGKLGFFCLLGPMQIFVSTHVSGVSVRFGPVAVVVPSLPPTLPLSIPRPRPRASPSSGFVKSTMNDDKKA